MMSDWRYHVASLSAVLLGIAVGLLIGGLYLSPAVPDQIAAQLKRLDEQLAARTAELRQAEAERETLKQALARADSLFARLLPQIAPRQLKDRRVALLITADELSTAQGIETLLTDAGAEVVLTLRLEWHRIEPEERSLILNNLPNLFNPAMASGARVVLSRRQGVRLTGDHSRPIDRLLWIGGYSRSDSSDEWLQSDSELIAALQPILRQMPNAPRLIACESFSARLSIIPLCKAADVPSVDCADLALGKSILLMLLQGESGNHGLKPTAESTFPETLLEQYPPRAGDYRGHLR